MCYQHPRPYTDFVSTSFEKHIIAVIAAILLHNMVSTLKGIFQIGPITQIFCACFMQGITSSLQKPNTTVLYISQPFAINFCHKVEKTDLSRMPLYAVALRFSLQCN